MTTRSSPGSATGTWKGTSYDPSTGKTSDNWGPFYYSLTWVNSVTHGDNVPGWRQKLREGSDATTSLTGTRISARFTPGEAIGYWKQSFGGYTYRSLGTCGLSPQLPSGNPGTLSYSKADAEALGKFNRRIREKRTAFEGGVFLGELGQTLSMIRRPARGLRTLTDEFLHAARRVRALGLRGAVRNARLLPSEVAEQLADLWLEAQFGWRPLMSDVEGACEALRLISNGQSLHTGRISAKGAEDSNVAETHTPITSPSGFRLEDSMREVAHCEVIYRGAIRVKARDPRTMDAALVGFDLSSFLPTAWELIPYSFLIDYFTNVGEIVTGWSNLFTELSWCNRTVRRQYKRENVVRLSGAPMPAWMDSNVMVAPAKFVCEKSHVLREKYTGTTVPSFTFRIPSFGSLKWLNIAALVLSRNADRKWVYGD